MYPIKFWARWFVLKMIRVYQKTLSMDHGFMRYLFPLGACRYTPTCSEYTYQAIEKYGIVKGAWKGLKRLLRCHPLAKGGHDPLE